MAQNDLILLDNLLSKASSQYGAGWNEGELFELFAFDQILKDYDLNLEEIQSGWVDSGDDGGIDGFFVFLNGRLLNNARLPETPTRAPQFEVWIITSKRANTFRQAPLNNLLASLGELFDLAKLTDEITQPFEQSIVAIRETFKQQYIDLAGSRPSLRLNVVYASRGDSGAVAPNVMSQAAILEESLRKLFSNCVATVSFFGAFELLELARRKRTYSLRLKFVENTISDAQSNYVLLTRLSDYFEFVTDDDGKLRRYLFESNVRDYMGSVPVNQDIAGTLGQNPARDNVDFWWLNNGVTILASFATIAGKEISLENVQIVNGLQTTESIFSHFNRSPNPADHRALLVKIIVTDNTRIRDRIIKATNYQSPVALDSLRATDRIQRDIEQQFFDNNWYYDRRRGYYRNQGMPADRIVSMNYLASCVRAIALHDPIAALKQDSRVMRKDGQYKRVFDTTWPLEVFLACLEVTRSIDTGLRSLKPEWRERYGVIHKFALRGINFLIAYYWVAQSLGNTLYSPAELTQLLDKLPSTDEVQQTTENLIVDGERFAEQTGKPLKVFTRLSRSRPFIDNFKTKQFSP